MRKLYRTLIVDDEPDARAVLRALITRFCPQLEIFAEAASVEDALSSIQQGRPDLLFLDVDLGGGNGFQVLDAFIKPDFKVVFTTGHQEFALDAFRYRAFHYLIKPIDPQDLIHVSRELEALSAAGNDALFVQREPSASPEGKLRLPSNQGIILIHPREVSFFKAEDKYAVAVLKTGEKIFIGKALKAIEPLLLPDMFIQPHQSYLVNKDTIRKVQKNQDGIVLLLTDATVIPVSRRNKGRILGQLGL